MLNLEKELPQLLLLACAWAEQRGGDIERGGRPLAPSEALLARRVGVRRPERVRIAVVKRIPAPEHELLKRACAELQFLGPNTAGLTLGYGIYIKDCEEGDRRLLAHELRHVAQYEERGSIQKYLAAYIPDLLEFGYERAPLELDARSAARHASDIGPSCSAS